MTTQTEEPLTLANLKMAYGAETNEHRRYLAFANRAEEDGYAPVASLLRAAARSEAIHARNHAEVIRSLGASPSTSPRRSVVRSVAQNLQAAVKSEVFDRDEMYPRFRRQADADGIQPATRTFQFAEKAEAGHLALFNQTLRLESLRGEAIMYFVCPVCGFTSSTDNAECPVCSAQSTEFEKVS
jgi:rubrerythrin